jgi:acetyltransferase-like isoleucine patch superfamily enzyme
MGLVPTRESCAAQIIRHGYEIGEFTYGRPAIWNYGGDYLKVGRYCSFADQVTLILGGHHDVSRVTTSPLGLWFPRHRALEFGDEPSGIAIGNDVWIGQGATIVGTRIIGDGAVIGAGAVVAKDVEPYAIVVGNPAREIRKRFSSAQVDALLEIRWWDWAPEKVDRFAPLLLGPDIDAFIAAARQTD